MRDGDAERGSGVGKAIYRVATAPGAEAGGSPRSLGTAAIHAWSRLSAVRMVASIASASGCASVAVNLAIVSSSAMTSWAAADSDFTSATAFGGHEYCSNPASNR
jgi:hypothetical protein